MKSSEQINELATALAKAQGEITGALKDSANPFFKSKYADLASCWDAARGPLSRNGLSVTQFPAVSPEKDEYLVTRLMHSSGQWIEASMLLKCKDDTSQAQGSSITYARRYAFAAVVGVAQIDDDGNAASGRSTDTHGVHRPQGDLGKDVPQAKVKETVDRMLKLMSDDIIGDHEDHKRAMIILDYHEKILNPDEDLYVAVGDALPAAKKNSWKALVSLGKKLEKDDRATDPTVRKF